MLFLITVGMGAVIGAQGVHLAQLSDSILHTHLHSGTLGWVTLGALGGALWLFGAGKPEPRPLSWLVALVVTGITLQLVTFYMDWAPGMVIAGTMTTVGVIGFFGWAVAEQRGLRLTVPRFGLLLGLGSFIVGGTIGVLVAFAKAGWIGALPGGLVESHPAGMMTGYLVPMAMGLIEWRASDGEAGHYRSGLVQMALVFIGFVLLVVGTSSNQMNLAGGSAFLTILAIAIFCWRVGPDAVRSWRRAPAGRFIALGALGLPVYVALLTGVISIAVSQGRDAVPDRFIAGMDHTVFIGVMTNALFGIGAVAVATERRHIWQAADMLVLLLANLGLVLFVSSLVVGFDGGERLGAPLMGTALALGIVVLLRRMIAWAPHVSFGSTAPRSPAPRGGAGQ